ncbi:hypothetical protein DAMA08_022730 [Martiniozyma asiatica (nom. inval.)]|nr:hypothetical protein DAMA08_022730 [Martiniozyma asiatica]
MNNLPTAQTTPTSSQEDICDTYSKDEEFASPLQVKNKSDISLVTPESAKHSFSETTQLQLEKPIDLICPMTSTPPSTLNLNHIPLDIENTVNNLDSSNTLSTTKLMSIKSTLLRLNLHSTLLKNELSSLKSRHAQDCQLLSKTIISQKRTLNVLQRENDAISSRNIKLVKYIKTLKNERVKKYVNENRRLKARLELLESNLESKQDECPDTSLGKLDTLGRVATVYLRESKK